MLDSEQNPAGNKDTAPLTSANVQDGSGVEPQSLVQSNTCIIAEEELPGSNLHSTAV